MEAAADRGTLIIGRDDVMQYMLMIYEDERIYGENKDNALFREMGARHWAFAGTLGAARVAGAGLQGTVTATTVREAGGARTVHDGPFAEAREQLGGFYLIDVPDLDAALEIARKVPLSEGGAIEVRPLIEPA